MTPAGFRALRRGHRRPRRLPARPADPRRRPPRPEPVEAPPRRRGAGPRPRHGRRLRPRRLRQAPPRHQHGLRRRARRPARRRSPPSAPPTSPPSPRPPPTGTPPVYVIGTEVPIPGGATEALDHLAGHRRPRPPRRDRRRPPPRLRRPRARRRLRPRDRRRRPARRRVRQRLGRRLPPARPPAPSSAALAAMPGFVFEAHSTDYQPPEALAALVRDGFAILKVGPALTFALREALYGLDHIAAVLDGEPPALAGGDGARHARRARALAAATARRARPTCAATATSATPTASATTGPIPRPRRPSPVCSPASTAAASPRPWSASTSARLYPEVAAGRIAPSAEALLIAAIQRVLIPYRDATAPALTIQS